MRKAGHGLDENKHRHRLGRDIGRLVPIAGRRGCSRAVFACRRFVVRFIGWFLGNSIASWVLGAVMLKFISPIVLKSKAFVKRVWA